jgi:hypothetical protein
VYDDRRLGHDSIIHVNLDRRFDRRQSMEKHAAALGICVDRFRAREFSEAAGFATPGVRGNMQSFLDIVVMAKEKRWKSVLLLEDDALLDREIKFYSKEMLAALADVPWDLLYYYDGEPGKFPCIVAPVTKVVYGSQGIAVHSRCYDRYIVAARKTTCAPDIFYAERKDWVKYGATKFLIRQQKHEDPTLCDSDNFPAANRH